MTALLFELCSKQTLSHYVGSAFLSEYVWLLLAMQVRFVASLYHFPRSSAIANSWLLYLAGVHASRCP